MSAERFDEGTVCVAFLGPKEIAKRARFGWVTAALALGAAAGLLATDASRLARAAVFLPALLAGYGFFQAREKT